ncbi:MAG: NAD(P)H-hydrate dehydratase [Clostridia bacterium]|nr:NAD(P)H-hydrate dehydratase [Clostridia bacterium]
MFFESITSAAVSSMLPARDDTSDKLGFGRLLCLCGSRNMPGAAVLACGGALRSGVGLCTIASAESVCRSVSYAYPGAVLNILSEHTDGGVSPLCAEDIKAALHRFSAVLFGCGVGITQGGRALLRMLLQDCKAPLVIDADGLNLLCENIELLKSANCPIILTTHQRELKRLLDAAGLSDAGELSAKYGVTVVAKDATTQIYGERNYILSSPNSALAKGGSGDILAGIIASLCAQGANCTDAAAAGVYIHSQAGRLASEMHGARSVLVTDIIDEISVAFCETEEDK